MAKNNIPVQNLEFSEIKTQLKEFLKGQSKFQDYDFEGSAMNIHMDILAFATHYMGFYAHMLNNESNVDSANLLSSLTSKAKFLNYVPGSNTSSRATVTFQMDVTALTDPTDRKIVIPRGTSVKANNNSSDNRTFILVDDLYIYNKSSTAGVYEYISDEVLIFEGEFDTDTFVYDSSILNQRFVIRDGKIDIDSIRVRVYETQGDSNFTPFKLAEDYMTVDSSSNVFFISMNEEGFYELHFGNGVYGSSLANDNYIEVSYITTNGEEGNNAKSFIFNGDFTYKSNDYPVAITTISNSEGGMSGESIEDLRFNIPFHYRRQNRAVIVDDYKNLLLSEYRNINSINVWGGEDNVPPVYGKVFISIKPKFGEILSSKAKENIIENIIKRRNVTVIEAEIVDPDYLYVDLEVRTKYNPINTEKSSGEIVSDIEAAISDYNENYLNKFGGFYSDLQLNTFVQNSNPSILTSYTKLTLEKRFSPTINIEQTYYVDFQNSLVAGTVKSAEFEYRLFRCYLKDDGLGRLRIYYYNTLTQAFEVFPDEYFGEVDYANGIVRITDFETSNIYNSGQLSVFATPENPDFYSKRNNIVTIDDVVVKLSEHFENENER